jgi:hypothetical protein
MRFPFSWLCCHDGVGWWRSTRFELMCVGESIFAM